jgi:uncharacterized MnhB-related membrane protein
MILVVMHAAVLVLVAIGALGVVLTRDPCEQAIAVSAYGLVLALMFLAYRAPDVALSQLVVGAVALPLMILLSLARIRRTEEKEK